MMRQKRNKTKREIITVMCYDKEEIWGDRNEAMDFYLECMNFSMELSENATVLFLNN